MMRILKSVSTLVSASSLPGLCGRNMLQFSKQMVSTQWKCSNLNNVSATPINIALLRLNYSTERPVSGGAELAKFLDEEIEAEQRVLRNTRPIPSQFHEFEVQLNGSEIILVKQSPAETISIYLNVSESSTEDDYEAGNRSDNEADVNDVISQPDFKIEFKRGDTVLRVDCSFSAVNEVIGSDDDEEEYSFTIDAVSIYKEKWQETNYSVEGDALVSDIHDMLHNILDEKGISRYFVTELVELCAAYEHTWYVALLKDLKKFVQ